MRLSSPQVAWPWPWSKKSPPKIEDEINQVEQNRYNMEQTIVQKALIKLKALEDEKTKLRQVSDTAKRQISNIDSEKIQLQQASDAAIEEILNIDAEIAKYEEEYKSRIGQLHKDADSLSRSLSSSTDMSTSTDSDGSSDIDSATTDSESSGTREEEDPFDRTIREAEERSAKKLAPSPRVPPVQRYVQDVTPQAWYDQLAGVTASRPVIRRYRKTRPRRLRDPKTGRFIKLREVALAKSL